MGTVLLNTCRLIERPSKKDGFCFKLFHPLDQSIWGTKVSHSFVGPLTKKILLMIFCPENVVFFFRQLHILKKKT